jgi:hypothetical protein
VLLAPFARELTRHDRNICPTPKEGEKMTPQTNRVSQNVVPLPVQQAASAQQLGTFLKVYKVSIVQVIATMFVIILFWGAGVFFLGSSLFEQEGRKLSVLACLIFCSVSETPVF